MVVARVVLAQMVCAAALVAQPVPEIKLRPADATLDAEFSRILAVRELLDGRLIVSDAGENKLFVVDFRSGRVETRSRTGRGPGEFVNVGMLFALPADSTVMTDDLSRRWLIMVGDSVTRTLPPDDTLILGARGGIRGVGRDGHAVFIRVDGRVPLPTGTLETLAVVAIRRGKPGRDTVARIRGTDLRIEQVGTKERPFAFVSDAVMSASDQASMAPDAWIAIASQSPYRITWRTPAGERVVGPVVPWTPVKVNAKEKREFIARAQRRGAVNAKVRDRAWSDWVSPFAETQSSLHSPDGRLLIRRMPYSGITQAVYDVFDRKGVLIGQVKLDERDRLVGFGSRSIYRVSLDEDDIQRLHRHPWP